MCSSPRDAFNKIFPFASCRPAHSLYSYIQELYQKRLESETCFQAECPPKFRSKMTKSQILEMAKGDG